MLNNVVYDWLKRICLIGIPAVNVLLVTLNSLWNWNLPIEAITGTLSAMALFIGTVLGFSSANYNKSDDDLEFLCIDEEGVDDGK